MHDWVHCTGAGGSSRDCVTTTIPIPIPIPGGGGGGDVEIHQTHPRTHI